MNATGSMGNGTLDVEAAMNDVARIYRTVTGQELPRNVAVTAPIPPERDARQVARDALAALGSMVAQLGVRPMPPIVAPVDCWETERELIVVADLPGVERGSIRLQLERGALVLTADRPQRPPEGGRPAALERGAGFLARTVLLPPGFAAGDVQAELADGVLRVRIVRGGTPHEPRTVEIR